MTNNFSVDKMVNAAASLSRKNRYLVDIASPLMANSETIAAKQSVMFNCCNAGFPGTTIGVNEQVYFGLAFDYPIDWKYTALDLEFYLDVDFTEKKFFETWGRTMRDPATARWGFKDDYVRDVTITSLDVAGNKRYAVKLIDAYPANIGQVSVAYDAKNSFATIPITLQFNSMQQVELSPIARTTPVQIVGYR